MHPGEAAPAWACWGSAAVVTGAADTAEAAATAEAGLRLRRRPLERVGSASAAELSVGVPSVGVPPAGAPSAGVPAAGARWAGAPRAAASPAAGGGVGG